MEKLSETTEPTNEGFDKPKTRPSSEILGRREILNEAQEVVVGMANGMMGPEDVRGRILKGEGGPSFDSLGERGFNFI
jgi:hypothetical protein